MKYLHTAVVFAMMMLCGCTKDSHGLQEGMITGPDLRECVCCGGWFILVEGSRYRFYEVPETSNIDLQNESFPLRVELRWKQDPQACTGDEILILSMNKI